MTTHNPMGLGLQYAQGLTGMTAQAANTALARRSQDLNEQIFANQQAQQQAAQVEAQQKQAQIDEAFTAYSQNPNDPQAMINLMRLDPELAKGMKAQYGLMDEEANKAGYNRAFSFLQLLDSNPEQAQAYFQQNLANDEMFKGLADDFAKGDIQGARNELLMGAAMMADADQLEALYSQPEGPKIGQYNPRDYTVESFAKFLETGDHKDLVKFAAAKTVDIGGVPYTFDPATGGYMPVTIGAPAQPETVVTEEVAVEETPEGVVAEEQVEVTEVKPEPAQPEQVTITPELLAQQEAERAAAIERAKAEAMAEVEAETAVEEEATITPVEIERANNIITKNQNLISTIDRAISLAESPRSTGIAGKALAETAGTNAYNLARALDTIFAALAFDELQAMRAASPTGGALGSVSERELQLLGAAQESLDQGQSKEIVLENLRKVKNSYNVLNQNIAEKHNIDYSAPAMSEAEADALLDELFGGM